VIADDLLAAGVEFAGRFTRYSLPVLEFARRAVQRAADLPLAEGLRVEADLSTLAYRTDDAEEGMAAFEEKRRPEFKDA
jgi:enoyl-CoA hydratase